MNEEFKATLARLKSQQSKFNSLDERAVEIGAVLPLLKYVGWNTEDILEIYPQRGLEDGSKVDYDLQIDGESRILIEVKRWRHDLNDEDEEQLARYCRLVRPKLAVLTSGRVWRLYLPPTNRGNNAPLRWFHEINIATAQPVEVETVFRDFLGRESMANSRPAVSSALKRYRESRALENTKKALTQAWNELAKDSQLQAKLILDFAESKGIHVSHDNVERFLESLDEPLAKEVAPRRKSRKLPASFALPKSPDGKRRATHRLIGNKGWNNLLSGVCEVLHRQHPESFHQHILSMSDRFAKSSDSKFSEAVGDMGIYAKWGLSDEIEDACFEMVAKFGYPKDSLVIRDKNHTTL